MPLFEPAAQSSALGPRRADPAGGGIVREFFLVLSLGRHFGGLSNAGGRGDDGLERCPNSQSLPCLVAGPPLFRAL